MALKSILITSTSFTDTLGAHKESLSSTGYHVTTARGPLSAPELQELIVTSGPFDGVICGEDEFTPDVIKALAPRCRVISKYGVGLDRIDQETANACAIQVMNTPGVNHSTVTELAFGLMLSLMRRIPEQNAFVHKGEWKRLTGFDLMGKTLGVFGWGRVGHGVSARALAFGMNVLIYNTSWNANHQESLESLQEFSRCATLAPFQATIRRAEDAEEALKNSDVVSLHMNLNRGSASFLDRRKLHQCKRGVFIVNVSRGGLIDPHDMADALRSGHVAGYGADVLEVEPVPVGHPLVGLQNVVITPHIGSRTREAVVRQGQAAVKNMVQVLEGY